MEVKLDGKTFTYEKPMQVRSLLKQLSLSPEIYLVSVNGELVTGDETIAADARVRIIRVVSGG